MASAENELKEVVRNGEFKKQIESLDKSKAGKVDVERIWEELETLRSAR